ncbi:5-amino-6-(D-ribitylamino)uracil--L-tyrosine 4-hydroxyphenyl transferase CofH, partial [Candidatus Binatia bacterium]|nr:5-amino-6-(D-ribitylamino)uracil--L-tyrosine 4-hydroxyphenyl transferase CofH [Candidatus Binatia bacterium]
MNVVTDEVRRLLPDGTPVERLVAAATPEVAGILSRAAERRVPSRDELAILLETSGADLRALVAVANHVRREDVGDIVTYVVNRNVNFTNVCFVNCQFCAFKRQRWESDAYNHGTDAVLAKVGDAVERGATEICMQGGINPQMGAFTYRDMLLAIKGAFPQIHMHAFSPMEVMYGSRRTNMPYGEYLSMLRDAGLGSIPGTAAEILDDEVREILSHKKVDVATWIEIITTAHKVGVPSTATIMYGHVETTAHVAAHLELVRRLQHETGGFTEFVPLRFIHQNTALYQRGLVQPTASGAPDFRMYAACRLFFRGTIDNLQTSWVKLGHELAALSLAAGVNDFGGTLMEESISREAGADAGEYTSVDEIERLIRSMGRTPRQRTTLDKDVPALASAPAARHAAVHA